MPRARRRRLKRQRKKWGVQEKPPKVPFFYKYGVHRYDFAPVPSLLQSISRSDLLALSASAKSPSERRWYRKMLENQK